jgi:integrase/recombinase XerC
VSWDLAAAEFLRYLEVERGASAHTRAAYGRDLAELGAHLRERAGGEPDPGRVSSDDIRDHVAELFGRCQSSSIARKLSAARSFFRFLLERGAVASNPVAAVPSPRRKRCPGPWTSMTPSAWSRRRSTARRRGRSISATAPSSRSSTAAGCGSRRRPASTRVI